MVSLAGCFQAGSGDSLSFSPASQELEKGNAREGEASHENPIAPTGDSCVEPELELQGSLNVPATPCRPQQTQNAILAKNPFLQ